LLSIAGCGPDFNPASYLTGLRVLAVKAEPPEVAPGQTATLTPLIFDNRGADAGALTYRWSMCLRAPLPGSSVSLDCFDSDLGADATTPLGEGESIQLTMPTLSQDQLGLPDFTGGVYLPVLLRVSDGVETVTAVYRLRYTQSIMTPFFSGPIQPPNHNPHIEDIFIDFERDAGSRPVGDLAIHTGDRVMLRAALPDSDHEQYPQIEGTLSVPDGGVSLDGGVHFFDGGLSVGGITLVNVNETLRVSWFANIGRVEPDVTGAAGKLDTTLYLDKFLVEPPADIDLYVVVRDDRGGIDFTRRTLLLR
jgi:hypothetical protein